MTAREFNQLVAECGKFARRRPLAYRSRLLLLATLGYAYILGILLLFGAAAALLLWIAGGSGGGATSFQLGIPLAGGAWIVLRSLRIEPPAMPGIVLDRPAEPRLFTEIEQVRRSLRAPRIHRVVLNNDLNAAVVQIPRWGPFGQYNVLVIGQTLLSTLTLDEFRAVLAHELGHIAGGHGRFSMWIYGIRARWMKLLDSITREGHWSAFLYRRFFQWYSPYFHAYSLVLSREHEFDADRAAVEIAGAEAAADGLARVAVTDRFLSTRFHPVAQRLPGKRIEPPSDFPGLVRQAAQRTFESPTAEQWLRQALAGTTHMVDSHPSLSDRIRSMGVPAPDPAAWCRRLKTRDGVPSADSLLDAAADHAARLAADWQERVGPAWNLERTRFEQLRTECETIEARLARAQAEPADPVRRVELTAILDGPQAALEAARSLVESAPGDADAVFLLAGILAELDDPQSIEYLDRAMTLDAAITRRALPMGLALLRRIGRDTDATAFEQCWESPAAESAQSTWTTPMSDTDRARVRAARAQTDNAGRIPHDVRFKLASDGATFGSAILLGIAGIAIAFFVWADLTPRLVPALVVFAAAGTAITCLIAYMVLRRKLDGEIDLLEEGVRVRVGRTMMAMRWTDVRTSRIRRTTILRWHATRPPRYMKLIGRSHKLQLSVRRADFPRLCEEVVRHVVASRHIVAESGPVEAVSGWRAGQSRAQPRVYAFRRKRYLLAAVALTQLACLLVGAFGSVELYIACMIGLGITAWRVAWMPFAVSVGLRWIRIQRPTGTDSILLPALAGCDVTVARGDFIVLVYNRFGESRPVPAVDGDVFALHDAIAANLELNHESSAAGTAPAPRARRRLPLYRPAVALAFSLLLYLPIASGLAVSEAARTGSIPAVRFLMAIGAPVDGRGVGGRTPLYRAATFGHMALVRMLVEQGADPTYGSGPTGFTPLHIAAERNQPDVVEYFLDLGVDPDITNTWNRTPLSQLAWQNDYGDNTATARLLLDRGANVDSRSIKGYTPLHEAVRASNGTLLELLVSRGADIDAATNEGSRPLHSAALADDVPMIRLLLRLGASINARRESDGRTPLALAAARRNLKAVRFLVENGGDPEIPDADGNRPIHFLVIEGADSATMALLLDHGADPNAAGQQEIRALPASILAHRNDLALALLDAGADPSQAAGRWTPLRAAFRTHNQDMVDELIRRGAK